MRSFDPPTLGHDGRVGTNRAFRFDLSTIGFQHVLIVLVALTAIRIVGLYFSVVDLFMDEAQYWAWSRELAYGYFSKPPLLAWIIAATDQVCGNGEACVRLASPLLHLATGLLVYAIAKELYGRQTAAWAALAYGFGPGVVFSARIISTDVPLLLFWAVALLAYLKLLAKPDWRWATTFGVAMGLGILAKYAMVYFLLGAGCAAWFDRDSREWLKRPQTWMRSRLPARWCCPILPGTSPTTSSHSDTPATTSRAAACRSGQKAFSSSSARNSRSRARSSLQPSFTCWRGSSKPGSAARTD